MASNKNNNNNNKDNNNPNKKKALEVLEYLESNDKRKQITRGILEKRGKIRKDWKEREFILYDRNLFYFEKKEKLSYKGTIQLSYYSLEDHKDDRENCFKLVPNKTSGLTRTYFMSASTKEEYNKWKNALKKAIVGDRNSVFFKELENSGHEVSFKDLQIENEVLGKGTYGTIMKGKAWHGTTDVAIKVLSTSFHEASESENLEFLNEIQLLSKLRHQNVLTMYGYSKNGNTLYLITRYIAGGDLSNYIFNPPNPYPISCKLEICLSIARGMTYLHSRQIMHRDLKPANILVENINDGSICLCDFGLSRFQTNQTNNNNNNEGIAATALYAAPELIEKDHTSRVDVYSFGIIMYEIWTGKHAWEGKSILEVTESSKRGERPTIPPDCLLNVQIQTSWSTDPAKRAEFATIYSEIDTIRVEYLLQSEVIENIPLDTLSLDQQLIARFNRKPSIPWSEFQKIFAITFNKTANEVSHVEFLFTRNGEVSLEHLKTILKWFLPLVGNDGYQNSSTSKPTDTNGWSADEILDLAKKPFFFGPISSEETKEILLSKPKGSFLFRFSSEAPLYVLSVADVTGIKQWKVHLTKHTQSMILQLEEKKFKTFEEIIEYHSHTALTSKLEPNVYLYLGDYVRRSDKKLHRN